jgi:hypothetical protein
MTAARIEGGGQGPVGHEQAADQLLAELLTQEKITMQARTAIVKVADHVSEMFRVERAQLGTIDVGDPAKLPVRSTTGRT